MKVLTISLANLIPARHYTETFRRYSLLLQNDPVKGVILGKINFKKTFQSETKLSNPGIFVKGMIFDIRRFCIHDGPGLRTTVFFKGCPLRCRWCHNPESQNITPETILSEVRMDGQIYRVVKTLGQLITVDKLFEEIMKDQIFFNESQGGVTFSGGEPLFQPDFLKSILELCKAKGIHTTVDTCGLAPIKSLKSILPLTDLFLYDLKHHSNQRHKEFTGYGNKKILQNLSFLIRSDARVIIRIPVIPAFNATQDDMKEIAQLLQRLGAEKHQIHLLPYHKLAATKYQRLGKKFQNFEPEENYREQLKKFEEIFLHYGFKAKSIG